MDNDFKNFEEENNFTTGNGGYQPLNTEEHFQAYDQQNNNGKKAKKSGNGMGKYLAITVLISLLTSTGAGVITYQIAKEKFSNQTTVQTPNTFDNEQGALTKTEIYDRVSPAVVTVSTKSIATNNFYFQQEVEGIGSGFIINEDGYILTNYHVIEDAKEVSVVLSDHQEVKAKVVNYDANKDVAMLKIVDNIKVPGIVELGDSDALKPGEDVIAIGTPMSKEFSQTTTSGIISAINRNVETSSGVQSNLLQTDTAINPGNSGGPLVNSRGQVIGINTLKVSQGAEGLGFAIPINDVKGNIEALSKPILNLGISVRVMTEEVIKQYNLEMEEGLYIINVEQFSAAEKAGIRGGDLITHFDGKRIKTFEELQSIKNSKNDGDTVKVTIQRDGKKIDLEVILKATE